MIIEERPIPPYKPRQTYSDDKPSYAERPVDIVEERQALNSQPNFLDEPFQIPSFFRSNFDEPAFAQFNPPFGASGMFVDFLKTIGGGDNQVPFAQPQLRMLQSVLLAMALPFPNAATALTTTTGTFEFPAFSPHKRFDM